MTPATHANPALSPNVLALVLLVVMIVAEFALFAFPAFLWALLGRQNLKEAFSWHPAKPAMLAGAALIGLGLVPWVSVLIVVQNHFFAPDMAKVKAEMQMFLPMMQHYPWLLVLGVPFAAALTEELLFRGPLQRALLRRMPMWAALVLGGAIFAGVHLDWQGFIVRTILGILLGWMVVRSGSLFPAILAHFVYDATIFGQSVWQVHTLGAARVMSESVQPAMGTTVTGLSIGALVGTVLLALGFWLCRRGAVLAGSNAPRETEPITLTA